MNTSENKSSILIDSDSITIWDAITDPLILSEWYVPGSPWEIPNLRKGEKGTFTLMPSRHNNLTTKLYMPFTIQSIHPYKEFAIYLDEQQVMISFTVEIESKSTKVTINSAGFDQPLENLKALIEGNEIPHF